MKIGLIFPGQGSQYLGMGEGFQDHPFFQKAHEALGFSLLEICLTDPEKKLNLTAFTQPCLVLYSLILFDKLKKRLEERNISVDIVLGHSVGEYSALAAGGAFTLEEALKAVHHRGLSMQKACPQGLGKMVAILKVSSELIEKLCDDVQRETGEVVGIANYNSPVQMVISGHEKACHKVIEKLESSGERFRAIPLPLSAPFHSPLMKPASLQMREFFKSSPLSTNKIPYIANINGAYYPEETSPEVLTKNLVEQVQGQVRWTQSIKNLSPDYKLIEVGPGKVLAGLCKKINPEIPVLSLDTENAFEKLHHFLET